MANDTKIDEVVKQIQQRILEGTYKGGEQLPAERELSEELHVSRQTVHSAMIRLQTDNQIDIRPREGAFVRVSHQRTQVGPLVPTPLRQKNKANLLNVLRLRRQETSVRDLEPPTVITAEPTLAQKMNLEARTEVARQHRLCLIHEIPYRIVDSYQPASLIDSVAKLGDNFFDGLSTFAQNTQTDAFERVYCRMPQAQEAELLNMSRNQPVFEIERWLFRGETMLIDYTCIIANAALHEFTYTYSSYASNWEDLSEKLLVNA